MCIRDSPTTARLLAQHDPRDPRHNRTLTVFVSDDAMMTVPAGYWLWSLIHAKDQTLDGIADDRMLAASVFESFRYLICECSKEESWRRIKLMREVIQQEPKLD